MGGHIVASRLSSTYHVVTFRDALGLAFELSATHGRGHYALLSDRGHRAVELVVRPPGCRRDPSRHRHVDLADGRAGWTSVLTAGGSLLVISVSDLGHTTFPPDRQAAYRRSQLALRRRNIAFRDWIQTDGDLFVSAAHTLHPESAWSSDPPDHRRADRIWARWRAPPPTPAQGDRRTVHGGRPAATDPGQDRPKAAK
jgi:hypothetical protein